MLNSAALGACSLLGIATAGMMWFWQDPVAEAEAARELAAVERAHAEAARADAEAAMEVAVASQQEAHTTASAADAVRARTVYAQGVALAPAEPSHATGGGVWSTQPELPGLYSGQAVNVAGFPIQSTQPAGQYRYAYSGDWHADSGAGEALAAYRDADTDEERDEAKTKLSEALGEEYDAILEQHEKHLAEMEERLEKLRGQLEKRRDARDDMVEMRVEALTSEADGLGWPSPPNGPHHVWGMPLFSAPAETPVAPLPSVAVPGVEIVPPTATPAPRADRPDAPSRPARRPRSGGGQSGSSR